MPKQYPDPFDGPPLTDAELAELRAELPYPESNTDDGGEPWECYGDPESAGAEGSGTAGGSTRPHVFK